jgi:acetyl esterase/lipase
MNLDKVHPQLRKTYSRIPAVPFHNPVVLALIKLLGAIPRRTRSLAGVSIFVHKHDSGSVRVYRPEGAESGAGVLWIHGGGYIIGDAATNDRECALYARDLGVVVVSVEYRLAPRNPFPCALDDCVAAWRWFQAQAGELGVAPERIAIAGQSAGGGLAAALAQRLFDLGDVQPAGQVLIYPMLDDRTAARRELDAIGHRLWHNRSNRGGWTRYLGQAPGQDRLPPYAAPARRENLSGLPPAWLGVGDIDLFYEESIDYATRLQSGGVDCELVTVSGAPHAFEMLVPEAPVSRDFVDSQYRFLRRVLAL